MGTARAALGRQWRETAPIARAEIIFQVVQACRRGREDESEVGGTKCKGQECGPMSRWRSVLRGHDRV